MTKKQTSILVIAILLLGLLVGFVMQSKNPFVNFFQDPQVQEESKESKKESPIVEQKKPKFAEPQKGFSRFYQEKYGITFVYPEIGFGLCFNDMTCDQTNIQDGFSYVSIVPNSAVRKDEDYLVKIRPVGISAGIDAADFASMINRVNADAGYLVPGSENTVLLKEGLGYMFDVNNGYASNGYESNGEEIYFVSGKSNSFVSFPGVTRSVLIFSQNNYLYEVLFEKDNSIAESVVSSIQFERQE